MLGDQVAQQLPQVHAIYLRKNEYLAVRAAQLRLLLEQGLRPERVLFVLLPIDVVGFVVESPEQYHIDASGVLSIQTPIPDWLAPLADKSRLAYAFGVRTHDAKRAYAQAANRLANGLAGQDRTEVKWLMHELAETCRGYGVPLSLVLLPNYEQ